MIQPHVHNGQRGVIGEGHGLAKLTTTLEGLSAGQTTQAQRETQIQEQLATLTQHVATLTTRATRQVRVVGVLGVLTLGLGGLVGWQLTHPPEQGYARALGSIDTTVGQYWPTLPKSAQEALADTYRRVGLVPPGQRK